MSRDGRRGRQQPSKPTNPPTFFQASCWPFRSWGPVRTGPCTSKKKQGMSMIAAPLAAHSLDVGQSGLGSGGGLSLLQQAEAAFALSARSVAKAQGQSAVLRGTALADLRAAVEKQVCTQHCAPCAPAGSRAVLSPPLSSIHCLRVLLELLFCSHAFAGHSGSALAAFLAYLPRKTHHPMMSPNANASPDSPAPPPSRVHLCPPLTPNTR